MTRIYRRVEFDGMCQNTSPISPSPPRSTNSIFGGRIVIPHCTCCTRSFSLAGYSRHLALTTNPPCVQEYERLRTTTRASPNSDEALTPSPSHSDKNSEMSRCDSESDEPDTAMDVDMRNADHSNAFEDIGGQDAAGTFGQHVPVDHSSDSELNVSRLDDAEPECNDHERSPSDSSSDSESDSMEEDEFEEAENAELEAGWEPARSSADDEPDEPEGHISNDTDQDLLESDPEQPLHSTADDAAAEAATRHEAQVALGHATKPIIRPFPSVHAGRPIAARQQPPAFTTYQSELGPATAANIYAPFASRMDYDIARWAKLRGPGSTAFTELLEIEGVREALGLSYKNTRELDKLVDALPARRPIFVRKEVVLGGEAFEFFARDIMQCVRALYGDPEFANHLIFAPERHYADEERTKRMYYDMHTGDWWWNTQKEVERTTPGATIVPLILSSDKTQVTMFRNKSCYPVYLSIGNIPKDIRRKPSRGGWILLAYLPVTRLEHMDNHAARRRAGANLFHACMREILEPIKEPSRTGVEMTSGDGLVRRVHPIVACYCGDYPEQVLVTGIISGDCPKCLIPSHQRESEDAPAELRDLAAVVKALELFDEDYVLCTRTCRNLRMKPIYKPFWQGHPYLDIFRSITPDVLHQLYQGILKHLLAWIKASFNDWEIDARCRRLPPNHNIRLFMKGITSLSRLSGAEHNQICRFLLGIIIDIPLPGGLHPGRLLGATRALLDFIYLSQFPCHTLDTLRLLDESLQRFHANKDIFISLGIRSHFNLPKLHALRHYIDMIQLFGSTDNYTTEYTERLHIDFAKEAYRASNRKEEYYQMTTWLERREKLHWHDSFVRWRRNGPPVRQERVPPDLDYARKIVMAKHPSAKVVSFKKLAEDYRATFFVAALCRFVVRVHLPALTQMQVERMATTVIVPFGSVAVFHKVKFHAIDALGTEDCSKMVDAIHCHPQRHDKRGKVIPGRFDTVLVKVGDGGNVGVKGYRVAQVRTVFTLSEKARRALFAPGILDRIPTHLAYVDWFSPFAARPERNHGMYKVSRQLRNGEPLCSVVALEDIRQSIHLIPRFGKVAPAHWSSSNVLDKCKTFFVNPFADRHAYSTIV